jgi:DNA (cytosine-5)-methyltransferase 1
MINHNPIQIVDLFAGPGGLSEGFAAHQQDFEILVSAEMDPHAQETLKLRAFYRILKYQHPEGLIQYYKFCNGTADQAWNDDTLSFWEKAGEEAQQLTLGTKECNTKLDHIIEAGLDRNRPWVLIGGPPCQAYSLAGRARNNSDDSYNAEADHRNFLYKEYLRIIQRHSPSVFVMENVKGILSSKVGGKQIFHEILNDLSSPDKALKRTGSGDKYVICSLVTGDAFHHGDCPNSFDVRKFIIRSEEFGIPQARHRVILLGIKESLYKKIETLSPEKKVTFDDAVKGLPNLRSRLSKQKDSSESWANEVGAHIDTLIKSANRHGEHLEPLITVLEKVKNNVRQDADCGALRLKRRGARTTSSKLHDWYKGSDNTHKLEVWLNNETRGHMTSDLRRYVYSAAYAEAFGRSPKGAKEFRLAGLAPAHKNWKSGNFSDRFRVQLTNSPASTVTSHISKDGHHFIHPDPAQCRSLTVREAARLQTFPDNYFFQGNRTQQFHQVGNAVPPLLAHKIASIVRQLLL